MSVAIQSINEMTDNSNKDQEISQLYNAVKHSIRRYLYELDGGIPNEMYEMVIRQVEQPLLEAVLDQSNRVLTSGRKLGQRCRALLPGIFTVEPDLRACG